jgi:hypothetical protein
MGDERQLRRVVASGAAFVAAGGQIRLATNKRQSGERLPPPLRPPAHEVPATRPIQRSWIEALATTVRLHRLESTHTARTYCGHLASCAALVFFGRAGCGQRSPPG